MTPKTLLDLVFAIEDILREELQGMSLPGSVEAMKLGRLQTLITELKKERGL